MGALQERITSTNKGSITSVQAIYVPADDLTDPAPATSFAQFDATTVLSRQIAELGIYPAVDPLDSTSRILDPRVVGEEHYQVARQVQSILQRYKSLPRHHCHSRHGRTLRGRQADRHARTQDSALPVAALPRGRSLHRLPRSVCRTLADTVKGFAAVAKGEYDHLPESAFYMVGTIEDALKKHKKWLPTRRRRSQQWLRKFISISSRRSGLLLSEDVDMVTLPGAEAISACLAGMHR